MPYKAYCYHEKGYIIDIVQEDRMNYRGTINVDFSRCESSIDGEYIRLAVALIEDGWKKVETSAYTRETSDISDLWRGIILLAKQSSSIGALSALTLHVQGAKDFENSLEVKSTLNPANALKTITDKPLPD
jgi:hypothetical protein